MTATIVHAQQTLPDGRSKVYRVPFETVRQARAYCVGHHHPERAVMVTPSRVVCFDAGRKVSEETL